MVEQPAVPRLGVYVPRCETTPITVPAPLPTIEVSLTIAQILGYQRTELES